MALDENLRRRSALGLAHVCAAGGNGLLRLLRSHAPEDIWEAGAERLQEEMGLSRLAATRFAQQRRAAEATGLFDHVERRLEGIGAWFVPWGADLYPPPLLNLTHPPAGLFVKGDRERMLEFLCRVRVTIVGTRAATPYGTRASRDFAVAFARRGIAVISGMALGIDGRAHEAALAEGALTVAVLGCGIDIVYPARHRALCLKIAQLGLVMSELSPGTPPARWTFPNRNRLLAALADGVMVVEGAVTSGAMQTAEQAAQLGRPVFALPGSIYGEGHKGCNLLIRDGATPTIEPETTVEEFLLQTRIERGGRHVPEPEDGPSGQCPLRGLAAAGREALLDALDERPCSIDALVLRTGMAARRLTAAMAELELAGLVSRAGPGLYIRAP